MNIKNIDNMMSGVMPKAKIPKIENEDSEKLKESCDGFESMFINQMLKTMRSTLSGEGLLDGGTGMDIYKSMYDQQISDDIANGDNGIGISDMLYRQLSKNL